MSNYEIISKEAISNAEVLEAINAKADQGEDVELTYREEKTQDYIKKFTTMSVEVYNKCVEEILALEISRLDTEQIIKIVELMPKNGTELRAIVSHAGIVLVDENVTLIIDVLNEYR